MARKKRNGRHKPRTPVNIIYRTIQASGGPTATARALGVSLPTLVRWRKIGRVPDSASALTWAGNLHPTDGAAAYALARQLAGLAPRRTVR